jgi:Mycolic acid cyclopropane synthetase
MDAAKLLSSWYEAAAGTLLSAASWPIFAATGTRSWHDRIHLHHVVIGYGLWTSVIRTTSIYKRASTWILNKAADAAERYGVPLIQAGYIPDFCIRYGIRLQLSSHLSKLQSSNQVETAMSQKIAIAQELMNSPLAIHTDEANQQHYEVPAQFYDLCLGPRKKYSSGLWKAIVKGKASGLRKMFFHDSEFADSENDMLALYCERAGIVNGMKIVDFGCGWGSLSLYLLEHFPDCTIIGISNSNSQREFILQNAIDRKLSNPQNLKILTVSRRRCRSS